MASHGRGERVSFSTVGPASDGAAVLRVLPTVRKVPAIRTVPNVALGWLAVRRAR